jgi:hypothetical protein
MKMATSLSALTHEGLFDVTTSPHSTRFKAKFSPSQLITHCLSSVHFAKHQNILEYGGTRDGWKDAYLFFSLFSLSK